MSIWEAELRWAWRALGNANNSGRITSEAPHNLPVTSPNSRVTRTLRRADLLPETIVCPENQGRPRHPAVSRHLVLLACHVDTETSRLTTGDYRLPGESGPPTSPGSLTTPCTVSRVTWTLRRADLLPETIVCPENQGRPRHQGVSRHLVLLACHADTETSRLTTGDYSLPGESGPPTTSGSLTTPCNVSVEPLLSRGH
ncbi:hypothetical protein J6590_027533 [Homalodisca vitripennis]|nr:hypothetical protein J6590_027533 [Homalodisca vitripennis]